MMLNRGKAQGKIELIASAIAQPVDFHILFVPANRNQH